MHNLSAADRTQVQASCVVVANELIFGPPDKTGARTKQLLIYLPIATLPEWKH